MYKAFTVTVKIIQKFWMTTPTFFPFIKWSEHSKTIHGIGQYMYDESWRHKAFAKSIVKDQWQDKKGEKFFFYCNYKFSAWSPSQTITHCMQEIVKVCHCFSSIMFSLVFYHALLCKCFTSQIFSMYVLFQSHLWSFNVQINFYRKKLGLDIQLFFFTITVRALLL